MNKTCKNCTKEFQIELEDFAFYEKIKVPPPTHCPDCRLQRRLGFRNERTLYKRECDACKKEVIGVFPPDTPFPVYCQSCWNSDGWDPFVYAREYDFSRPFFEQFRDLQKAVPRQHVINAEASGMINSVYTNCAGELKNCYLVFGAQGNEDCLYSQYINFSRGCLDCLYTMKSEYCYNCFDIERCYNVQNSQSCIDSRDSLYIYDCRNVSDCIGCIGLRNKQYCILNQQYSKEEYLHKKEALALDTRKGREDFKRQFYTSDLYTKFPRKYYHGQMNSDVTGDYVSQSEKSKNVFYGKGNRGTKHAFWSYDALDSYDIFAWGQQELCYETVSSGYGNSSCKFIDTSWSSDQNLEYSSLCFNSKNLFGCIGLKNKEYCILNKQHGKEEYETLITQITEHMKSEGEYGEFFPLEMSPFPYWDSVAQEHFPLTKEQILARGYHWREPEKKQRTATFEFEQLPEMITEVSDTILQETISCAHKGICTDQCTHAFRITPAELAFYKAKSIPLPTLCFQCRHVERVELRNPLKLWHRSCMCTQDAHKHPVPCRNELETSYAPNRPEIVYCESCYQGEVA